MIDNHGSDVVYSWSVRPKTLTVEVEVSVLSDLLIASHAQFSDIDFLEKCPNLHEQLIEAQDKARQALKWGDYAEKK